MLKKSSHFLTFFTSGGGKALLKGLPEMIITVFLLWFEDIESKFSCAIKVTNNVLQIGRVFRFSGVNKMIYFFQPQGNVIMIHHSEMI